jgi:hypothetical protein
MFDLTKLEVRLECGERGSDPPAVYVMTGSATLLI